MPDDTGKTTDDAENPEDEELTPPETKPAKAAKRAPTRKAAPPPEPEDEDEAEVAAPARRSGGPGALVAIVIVIIVVALVTGVYLKIRADNAAKAERKKQMDLASTQLATLSGRVDRALASLEEGEPDVDRAVEALNAAAEGVATVAQAIMATDAAAADRLVALQGDIQKAAQDLAQDKAQYLERIKAAREELTANATRRVRPLKQNLETVANSLGGGVEAPLVPSTPGKATGAATPPAATTEPASPAAATPAPAAGATPTPATGTQPEPAAPKTGQP